MNKKLNKILFNVLRNFSVPLSSFLISLIGIKFFGELYWGNFLHYLIWLIFLAFIISFGNKDYLVRIYSHNPSKIAVHFTRNLVSRSIFLILTIIPFFVFELNIAFASFILLLLLFLYQSFESLVIYFQKFQLQLIAEILGFTIIILGFVLFPNLDLENLIYLFSFSNFIKIIILMFNFKHYFSLDKVKFSFNEIKLSFPFFLIVFSGWMASKIDLYLVNIYLTKKELAAYQLIITAFILLRSFSTLIIYPFSKNIYRLPIKTIDKIKRKLAFVSLPVVILGTIAIWVIFEKILALNLLVICYILGGLSAVPLYFFSIDLFIYYKEKKEKKVVFIGFFSTILNLGLCLTLIPIFNIQGALASLVLTQFTILLVVKSKLIL